MMNLALLIRIAQVFSLLSLISIGGFNAVLPELRRQVVGVEGWMNDATFTHLFAISNAAPGPNLILVSLIGLRLVGFPGLVVATLAIVAPSCLLAFAAARGMRRFSQSVWVARLKAGLAPLALGLILASGASMVRIADRTVLTALISVATAAFLLTNRRNPLWALAAGAVVSAAAVHFHA
jgi:chromate transporter